MGGLNENGLINVKNKSHSITAQIVAPEGTPANGVILSQGGIGGGWMFYVKDGKLTYIYNFLGLQKFVITSTQVLSPGKHQIRMEFAYDGGGLAKGGTVTLLHRWESRGRGPRRPDRSSGFLCRRDVRCRRQARLSDNARHAAGKERI